MPEAGKKYGPKEFKTLKAAYNAYQKDRFKETTNPTIPSKDKFSTIWGWNKKGLLVGKD